MKLADVTLSPDEVDDLLVNRGMRTREETLELIAYLRFACARDTADEKTKNQLQVAVESLYPGSPTARDLGGEGTVETLSAYLRPVAEALADERRQPWASFGLSKEVLSSLNAALAEHAGGILDLTRAESEPPGKEPWTVPGVLQRVTTSFDLAIPGLALAVDGLEADGRLDLGAAPCRQRMAFCAVFPTSKSTRIFVNLESESDAAVLAHELGHAFHYDVIGTERRPATIVAETAAMIAERLLADHPRKAAIQYLAKIPAQFDFVVAAARALSEGELLTSTRADELMRKAMVRRFSEEESLQEASMWRRIPHFYMSGLHLSGPAYTAAHLLSGGFARLLAARSPDERLAQYRRILAMRSPAELAAIVRSNLGSSLDEAAFWSSLIAAELG